MDFYESKIMIHLDIFILKENWTINPLLNSLYSYGGLDDVYPKSF